MNASTTALVAANAMNKGDVLATARVAGIQAAKFAATLLPMSHPVLVGNVHVNFTIADSHIDVEASVDTVDRTGVEMEALMAVTVAALTVYDMCKSADRTMTIERIAIWEKSGGRSGTWRREDSVGNSPSLESET
jgi:cyclic pyranopterin phosphate synthase